MFFFFSVKQMTRLICVNVLESFLRVSFTKLRKMLSQTDKKVSNPPRCSRLSVRLSGSEKSRNLNSFKVLFEKNGVRIFEKICSKIFHRSASKFMNYSFRHRQYPEKCIFNHERSRRKKEHWHCNLRNQKRVDTFYHMVWWREKGEESYEFLNKRRKKQGKTFTPCYLYGFGFDTFLNRFSTFASFSPHQLLNDLQL